MYLMLGSPGWRPLLAGFQRAAIQISAVAGAPPAPAPPAAASAANLGVWAGIRHLLKDPHVAAFFSLTGLCGKPCMGCAGWRSPPQFCMRRRAERSCSRALHSSLPSSSSSLSPSFYFTPESLVRVSAGLGYGCIGYLALFLREQGGPDSMCERHAPCTIVSASINASSPRAPCRLACLPQPHARHYIGPPPSRCQRRAAGSLPGGQLRGRGCCPLYLWVVASQAGRAALLQPGHAG